MKDDKDVLNLLNPRVRDIAWKLGIRRPTLIQQMAIPKLLGSGKHAIIVAPTGAGKTEAAILPILSKMFAEEAFKPFSLIYVTPLRALNRDIFRRLKRLLDKLGISVDIRHGDTPARIRRRQTVNPPVILITTPETLNILLWGPKIRSNFKNTRYIIIDEIHEISDSKRGVQLALVLERIKRLCGKPQIILLSATVANAGEVLKYYTCGEGGEIIESPEAKRYKFRVIFVEPELEERGGILLVRPNLRAVVEKIKKLISKVKGKVLIFTNTRDMAEAIGAYLGRERNIKIAVHHSAISRELRVSAELGLREGDLKAVVATSSLELGIDIGDIEHVILVNSPRRVEVALQRVGRSGHFIERPSIGTIITMSIDDFLEAVSIAALAQKGVVEPITLIYCSYDVLAHQVVGIIRDFRLDMGRYPTIGEVYDIVRRAYPYKDLSLDKFLSLCRFLHRKSRAIRIEGDILKLSRNAIRLYIENVSMIPHNPKFRVVDAHTRRIVGELDEIYAYNLREGSKFVLGGRCREVLQIDPLLREVLIRDANEITEPPSWIGELLPVSMIVAKNVGVLRRKLSKGAAGDIRRMIGGSSVGKIFEKLRGIKDPPDDRTIHIEHYLTPFQRGVIIIHSCSGDRINRTMALVVFRLLLEETSLPVIEYASDPYRIYIYLYPTVLSGRDIRVALFSAFRELTRMAENGHIDDYVRETLRRDKNALLWYFINVARRFGILRDESPSRDLVFFLMRKYERTVVMEEAINEYINVKLDIHGLRSLLEKIREGSIELRLLSKPSIFSYPEVFILDVEKKKEKIHRISLQRYKERLLRRRVKWFCMQCGYVEVRKVSEGVWDRCPRCGSRIVTVSKVFDFPEFIMEKIKRKEELSARERKRIDLLFSIGMLLRQYPQKTLLAVAASGTNLRQCISIIQRIHDEEQFLERLRDIEARFIKSQVFE